MTNLEIREELQKYGNGSVAVVMEKRPSVGVVRAQGMDELKTKGFPVGHLTAGFPVYLGLRLPGNATMPQVVVAKMQIAKELGWNEPVIEAIVQEATPVPDEIPAAPKTVELTKGIPEVTIPIGARIQVNFPGRVHLHGRIATVVGYHPHRSWVHVKFDDTQKVRFLATDELTILS